MGVGRMISPRQFNLSLKSELEVGVEIAAVSEEFKDKPFYNGVIFHRVIKRFMNQGGGFTPDYKKVDTREPIKNEADNGLKNTKGTVAMARTSDPDSATSQFFINVASNDFLNHRDKTMQGWGYAVFGEVVEGMDVVDAIAQVATGNAMGHGDVPVEDVVITGATIV